MMERGELVEKIIERFHQGFKVGNSDECWRWEGYKQSKGYGHIWYKRKRYAAHRISYIEQHGYIPDDMVIDHICRTRDCVNPSHLRVLSNKDNVLCGIGPSAINSAKTHCSLGHPLSGENLYIAPKTSSRISYRMCRACKRMQHEARRAFRAEHGKPCPICKEKAPLRCATILLPGKQCKIHGYRDPREPVVTKQTYGSKP